MTIKDPDMPLFSPRTWAIHLGCVFGGWLGVAWQVDPFFAEGVKLCRDRGEDGGSALTAHVEAAFERNTSGGV